MANRNSDRAADTEVGGKNTQNERGRGETAQPSQGSATASSTERRSRATDANELGPDVGPGRRATDRPVSPPAKSLQRLAVVALVVGLTAGFLLVSADGMNRFLGVGLAFFAGGLAVWRLLADDMHRSVAAIQVKDDKIRRLMARCEELEDRAWELGESDERHASILATLGDVVIRRDQAGLVTYVNSAADDVFGSNHSLQTGNALQFPLVEATVTDEKHPHENAARMGGMGFEDLHIETLQGKRWFSRIDIPVRDSSTDRQLVQTVLRDVTERRLIEEDLLAARHSAENSNEAKSRFLATVSHEIRTPLNGVLGMAALLRDTRLTKEQHAYIEALETSGETLLLLIDEVLDFSKVEAGKLDIHAAPTPLGTLAESVVELLAPKAHAKNLEIGAILAADLPAEVTIDATRVRQILFNLIGNGVKFTDQGGVAVDISGRPNPAGGSFLDIEVRDTGIGFDEAEAERLFREFEQVDHGPARKFGGTGLGLAIAQKLAGLMGGSISAGPNADGGAAFCVKLPIPESLECGSDPRFTALDRHNIVFVSNSVVEGPLLAKRLDQHGADVAVLAPGDYALEDRLASADLLVVDNAALSDSGGWLATARLAGCEAPAIVMIAPPERDRLEHLRAAGYAAYLIRPARIETVAQIFSGLLEGTGIESAWDVSAEPASNGLLANRAAIPARPLRLLVAEDNDINRLLSEALLRKLGHVPIMVNDGEEAVEAAAHGSFDAILMDLHMPGLDGFQAIAKIREDEKAVGRTPVPVLIVTADVMKDARDKAKDVGAAGYLTKPLSVDAIFDALSEITRN
ncbi:PAS domain-containing hybrid sensor histidine kinase/response regulator [uncultured Roseibium sp.]|uniref:PAS domain-containing hybrid sensor histidine kinase/response regulator n=1 Tax=uncultured Roseibium sp. TaxID=1936171 RepID=UPI002604DAF5|nr:PAS domain-containing hybrid sensor histidine kinase/response regulator [uncultured Roseibium sp.]